MKNLCLSALFLMLFFGIVRAQQTGHCGMTREQLNIVSDRALANLATEHGVTERTIKYVPVRMILVANDDATGRVKERKVLELLCSLNERFAAVGFRFYIENGDFKYVNDSGINLHQSGNNVTKMKFHRSNKAINYFLVDECDFGNNPNGNLVILGYYTPDNDWLVIREGEVNNQSSTVAHETGHFFSLLHPFNGWDHDEWADGSTACAPANSPTGIPTEKVDGSNCTTAGDFLCDTPPSYNFVLDQSDCANNAYNGGAKDPMCVPLKNVTQADNYMDYFVNCQTYKFTAQQIGLMETDLNTNARNFLDNTYAPPAETLAAPADMCVSPINGAATTYFDQFNFKWNAVPGATLYFFEMGITAGLNTTTVYQTLAKTTEINVKFALPANTKRYWRVTPMNEYATCMGAGITSTVQNFITGGTSGTVSIEGLSEWGISPNPVSTTVEASLKTISDNTFTADIEIASVSGKLVFSEKNHDFASGESNYVLPTHELAAGAYLVSLAQPTGRLTKKLVITN